MSLINLYDVVLTDNINNYTNHMEFIELIYNWLLYTGRCNEPSVFLIFELNHIYFNVIFFKENIYEYDNYIGVINEGGNHWTLVVGTFFIHTFMS